MMPRCGQWITLLLLFVHIAQISALYKTGKEERRDHENMKAAGDCATTAAIKGAIAGATLLGAVTCVSNPVCWAAGIAAVSGSGTFGAMGTAMTGAVSATTGVPAVVISSLAAVFMRDDQPPTSKTRT